MQWWESLILGLVEGTTEFLPVSSTGHLIIAASLLGLDQPHTKTSVDALNIVIQGGAILAVLALYWSRVRQMVRGLGGADAGGRRLAINLVVAFMPAALLGPLLDDWIEGYLFSTWPVLAALFFGGLWMMWIDHSHVRPARERSVEGEPPAVTLESMTARQALVVGFAQCVAMWPGTSRSMMAIAGGVLVGLRPRESAEFSFLLGLPTLGAACAYKLLQNITRSAAAGTPNLFEQLGAFPVLLALVAATLSAAVAARWLVGFLARRGLSPFGWYRIALSTVLAMLIYQGAVRLAG